MSLLGIAQAPNQSMRSILSRVVAAASGLFVASIFRASINSSTADRLTRIHDRELLFPLKSIAHRREPDSIRLQIWFLSAK